MIEDLFNLQMLFVNKMPCTVAHVLVLEACPLHDVLHSLEQWIWVCQSARGPTGVTELQYIIVFLLFIVLISPHTTVPCPCLSLSEPLRVQGPFI